MYSCSAVKSYSVRREASVKTSYAFTSCHVSFVSDGFVYNLTKATASNLLELGGRFCAVAISVRVPLPSELMVGFLDGLLVRIRADPKRCVIVEYRDLGWCHVGYGFHSTPDRNSWDRDLRASAVSVNQAQVVPGKPLTFGSDTAVCVVS